MVGYCLGANCNIPVKDWVARVLELNDDLREFLKINRTAEQNLNNKEIMVILEYEILYLWRREFDV